MAEHPPNMVVEAFRIPPALRAELVAAADRRGLDKSTAIREALTMWLTTPPRRTPDRRERKGTPVRLS